MDHSTLGNHTVDSSFIPPLPRSKMQALRAGEKRRVARYAKNRAHSSLSEPAGHNAESSQPTYRTEVAACVLVIIVLAVIGLSA